MIILYPDRHVRALNIGALVQRALRGELYLLLEDGQTVSQIAQLNQGRTEFVDHLEPGSSFSTDVLLACLLMAVDSPHDTIGAMEPHVGFILYSMLVYMLALEPALELAVEPALELAVEPDMTRRPFEDLEPVAAEVATELAATAGPAQSLMERVYHAVKAASDRLLGGIPRNVRLADVKAFTERAIARRTGLLPLQHMVFYNFIEREKVMARRISEAVAANPALDVHVVIGACHVTGNLSDEFINTLNVNVPSYVELNNLIEQHYPGQRLANLLGPHEVR